MFAEITLPQVATALFAVGAVLVTAVFLSIRNKRRTRIDDLKVHFYTEAAAFGSHGKIKVSHRRLGLVEKTVNFVLEGVTTPPLLTPSLIEHIWISAKEQGYIPLGLVDALEINAVEPATAATDVLSMIDKLAYTARVPVPEGANIPEGLFKRGAVSAAEVNPESVEMTFKSGGYDAAVRDAVVADVAK